MDTNVLIVVLEEFLSMVPIIFPAVLGWFCIANGVRWLRRVLYGV